MTTLTKKKLNAMVSGPITSMRIYTETNATHHYDKHDDGTFTYELVGDEKSLWTKVEHKFITEDEFNEAVKQLNSMGYCNEHYCNGIPAYFELEKYKEGMKKAVRVRAKDGTLLKDV
jgi:hypothetical protein